MVLIGAVDPETAFDVMDVRPVAGCPTALGADAIAVYDEGRARTSDLRIGRPVPVVFNDTGLEQLRVALIYGEHSSAAGDYFLGHGGVRGELREPLDYGVYVKTAPGVDDGRRPTAAVRRSPRPTRASRCMDQPG